jgi:hypothetical protein
MRQRNLRSLEMTRRGFIQFVLKTASVFAIGAYFISQAPRKFINAIRYKKYPGIVKPLSNINTQGKWSG